MEDKVLKAGAPLTFEQKRALMDRFFATNEYIDAVPGAWEDDPSTEPSMDDPEPPFPDYDSEGEEGAAKYNPHHDARGRFARGSGASGGRGKPKKAGRVWNVRHGDLPDPHGTDRPAPGSLRQAGWLDAGDGPTTLTTAAQAGLGGRPELRGVHDDVLSQIAAAQLPRAHTDGLAMRWGTVEADAQKLVGRNLTIMYKPGEKQGGEIILMTDNKAMPFDVRTGTVFHEIGHHVWSSMRGAPGEMDSPRISLYAQASPHEHFAEAYKAFVVGGSERARLKKREPRTYKTMERVFTDASLFT